MLIVMSPAATAADVERVMAAVRARGFEPKPVPGAATAAPGAKPGDKKSVKSEKLSSSWADDAAKKRAAAG